MFLSLVNIALCSQCTETIDMRDGPFVYEKVVPAGSTVCINSSDPFLALILNKWARATVYTHVYRTSRTITYGPYFENGGVGGFDFGNSPASVDITVFSTETLSFGAANFDSGVQMRILSNHPDEILSFADGHESIEIKADQEIQYFNAAPGERRYEVQLDVQPSDHLSFTGRDTSVSYTGQTEFTRSTTSETAEVVMWKTNSSVGQLSQRVDMSVKTPKFKPKRYARIVSNGNGYNVVPVFDLCQLSAGEITGIALGATLGGVLLITGATCAVTCICRAVRKRQPETQESEYESSTV